jgi:hypothetical protein
MRAASPISLVVWMDAVVADNTTGVLRENIMM